MNLKHILDMCVACVRIEEDYTIFERVTCNLKYYDTAEVFQDAWIG
jgi:hypothetical protein